MEIIKTENLAVGIEVAMATPIRFGWGCYTGLIKYSVKTISRITPKKTKVVCNDGVEYATNNVVFYQPCEEMIVENRRVIAFYSILRNIRELYGMSQKNFVDSVEKMEAAAEQLQSVYEYAKTEVDQ